VSSRFGFTLVEIIAALSIGALVMLLAHAIVGSTTDQVRSLSRADEALSRESNGYRWLAETLRSVHVGASDGSRFDGTEAEVRYSTWLLRAGGWSEMDRVRVGLDGAALVAALGSGRSIILRDSVRHVEFDYLRERGERSPWVGEWTSDVAPPIGLRIRVSTGSGPLAVVDTLLLAPRAVR
jgi:prepilin-type N-terminal cleavage/methylation domain-containing protein